MVKTSNIGQVNTIFVYIDKKNVSDIQKGEQKENMWKKGYKHQALFWINLYQKRLKPSKSWNIIFFVISNMFLFKNMLINHGHLKNQGVPFKFHLRLYRSIGSIITY